jgi:hypothetical protein
LSFNNRTRQERSMNDENLKQYFLGRLSEDESNSLEIEVAESEELSELAQIVEVELIDDYLEGSLLPSDKLSFETHYLTTAARLEKVKFAHLFLAGLKRQRNLGEF